MAAAYCYERIPLRFLASLFDIQMRYLVYMRYLWSLVQIGLMIRECAEIPDSSRVFNMRYLMSEGSERV